MEDKEKFQGRGSYLDKEAEMIVDIACMIAHDVKYTGLQKEDRDQLVGGFQL